MQLEHSKELAKVSEQVSDIAHGYLTDFLTSNEIHNGEEARLYMNSFSHAVHLSILGQFYIRGLFEELQNEHSRRQITEMIISDISFFKIAEQQIREKLNFYLDELAKEIKDESNKI